MKTEKEKMLAGELYLASDPELTADHLRAQDLAERLNGIPLRDTEQRLRLLGELLGSFGENSLVKSPFYCDYGYNIHLGKRVFVNFGCVFLDVCRIDIGDDVFFAPNVQLYAAAHPLDWELRKHGGPEYGKPIRIGSDSWLGGSVIVLPGVSIGDRCVIGAGSVVAKSIPDDSLAVGNPAKIVRKFSSDDGKQEFSRPRQ